MLKTSAAVISVMLLLHTTCYVLCTDPESATLSESANVPGAVPSCHGMPEKGGDPDPQPVHHDERCQDCLYFQVVSDAVSLNVLSSSLVELPTDIPVIKFQEDFRALMLDSISAAFSGSPPSRLVLRI